MARLTQVMAVLLAALVACSCVSAAAPSTQTAEAAVAVRAEADALLKLVIQKPYGWAVAASPPVTDARMPKNAVVVSMESTAGAMLLLNMAGDALKEERYWAAARQLARGIGAAQQPSGRVPATATFGNSVMQREVAGSLSDRGPTTAAIGAALVLLRSEPENDVARRVTNRAVAWLLREQSQSGLWMSFQAKEEGGAAPQRVLRLDTADQRDCIVALTLAADLSGEKVWRKAAERAADGLLRTRLEESRTARALWRGAYDPAGGPTDLLPHVSLGVDVIACRRALDALSAASLLLKHAPSQDGARSSAAALVKLRFEDGLWTRTYPLRNGELITPIKGPAPKLSDVFKPLPEDVYAATGEFGLPEALKVVAALGETRWEAKVVQDRLAMMLVGALESPLTTPPVVAPSKPADEASARVERLTELLVSPPQRN